MAVAMLALHVLVLTITVVCGDFIYFQAGQEYQYKFESKAKVKGLDTFNIHGLVS